MTEKENIRAMVDEDIIKSQEVWEAHSHDGEEMERLFHRLYCRYKEKIDGFAKGLQVTQPYESVSKQAEAYRNNVCLLLERLTDFRGNGYRNEGLMEYYIQKEHKEVSLDSSFMQIRMELGMMEGIAPLEREEIMQKLSEMEEICCSVLFKREKWDLLRQYMIWLSGKDVDIAMKLLPIFFKIS